MIYLDYQATTPLAPEARAAMLPWLEKFGNPHSPHRPGREAKAAVEVARAQILAALLPHRDVQAKAIGISDDARQQSGTPPLPGEVPSDVGSGRLLFTSGATEAANWAIAGSWRQRPRGRDRIVTVATEHACVLDTVQALRSEGADPVVLPVDGSGAVDMDVAAEAIDERTAIVATMLVNNEIGRIADVRQIARLAHHAGARMFCDAVQGFGRIAVPVSACDLIAISAHKIHGPKGIGALWIREGHMPAPLLHGGGQEGGVRSGTLSPMLCAGFGAAAELAAACRAEDTVRIAALADRARSALGHAWQLNGAWEHRYPGNLNVRRDGLDSGRLISELRGVALSAGSACASGSGRPSHVLRAIGLSDAEARSSIRLGFGRYTTEAELDEGIALINEAAERQRAWA